MSRPFYLRAARVALDLDDLVDELDAALDSDDLRIAAPLAHLAIAIDRYQELLYLRSSLDARPLRELRDAA